MENGHREARELVARVLKEKEFDSVSPKLWSRSFANPARSIASAPLRTTTPRRAKACLNGRSDSEYAAPC